MAYCGDFETTIDRYVVLDYVISNKEWFIEKLNAEDSDIKEKLKEILDKHNNIRILRDNNLNNFAVDAVDLYNDLERLYKGE